MKKSILLLAFIVTTLFSCSNNEDNSNVIPNSTIVGKWDLKSQITGTTNVMLSPCEIQYNQYQFFENLTAIENEGYTNGNTNCTNYTYNQTYKIEDKILTITENSDNNQYVFEYKYKILELTSTNLKIKLYYTSEKSKGKLTDEENIPENEQTTNSYEKI